MKTEYTEQNIRKSKNTKRQIRIYKPNIKNT